MTSCWQRTGISDGNKVRPRRIARQPGGPSRATTGEPPAQILHRHTRIGLPEVPDDLLFAKSLLHVQPPFSEVRL